MIFKLGGLLGRRGPEFDKIRIGYVPTVDAAVLLVAQAKGFFENEGLKVELLRQSSWQRAAEKLANRELEAAQLSATEPLAAHLGMHGTEHALRTSFVLALGGSSFGLSPELASQLHVEDKGPQRRPASMCMHALAQLIRQRQAAGEAPLRFVVTDHCSIGSYDLRYCLASVGIDPAQDVQLVPITPSRMLATLRKGAYDGAWLDEPYGSLAQAEGLLTLLFSKQAFWNNSLGKVLAVRDSMSKRTPRLNRALLRALLTSAEWIESYREDAVDILASKQGLDVSGDLIEEVLLRGIPTAYGRQTDDFVFAEGAANFPWYSQAVWYLGQMIRWGDYKDVLDFKKTAQTVFQPRYYRDAARELSLPHPSIGYKDEGLHAGPWVLEEASQAIPMGSDLFLDDRLYKPRETMAYLNAMDISHIAAPLDAMWAIR